MHPIDFARAWIAAHPDLVFGAFVAWFVALVASLAVRTLHAPKFLAFEQAHPVIGGALHLAFGVLANSDQVRRGVLLILGAFGITPPPAAPGGGSPIAERPTSPSGGAYRVAIDLPLEHRPRPAGPAIGMWRALVHPPKLVLGALFVLGIMLGTPSCRPAITPESAGAGVLSLAEANRIVADACGSIAVTVGETKGKAAGQKVLDQCKANHDRVHGTLLTFADGVDAWRAGKAGAPSYAALDVRQAMLDELDFARSLGASISTRVDDSVGFLGFIVSSLLGKCEVSHG